MGNKIVGGNCRFSERDNDCFIRITLDKIQINIFSCSQVEYQETNLMSCKKCEKGVIAYYISRIKNLPDTIKNKNIVLEKLNKLL
jgi:hypothetical protein